MSARRFLTTIVGTFSAVRAADLHDRFRRDAAPVRQVRQRAGLQLAWITLLRLPAYTEMLLGFAVLVGSIARAAAAQPQERADGDARGRHVGVAVPAPGLIVAAAARRVRGRRLQPAGRRGPRRGRAAVRRGFRPRVQLPAIAERRRLAAPGRRRRPIGDQCRRVTRRGLRADRPSPCSSTTRTAASCERIDGSRAQPAGGLLAASSDALVSRMGREPERFETYMVSTYLTPGARPGRAGPVISLSVWDLPGLIEVAEKAGLSASRFRVQYELLLSRPLLLLAMVLLAATVSLRSFRSGGIQTMVIRNGRGIWLFSAARGLPADRVAGLVSPHGCRLGAGVDCNAVCR